MRDALVYQPLQYTVNRDPIHRMVIGKHCGNIQMRGRVFARKQTGEHRDARLREPLTGGADGSFGGWQMREIDGLHGQLHLTLVGWQLQLSSILTI